MALIVSNAYGGAAKQIASASRRPAPKEAFDFEGFGVAKSIP
jgi:hypothetical protein